MKLKPHKCQDQAYQELLALQQREGKLKLMHFRRVKQLGAGDVGLVDLVQLQVCDWEGRSRAAVHVLCANARACAQSILCVLSACVNA